MAIPKAYQAQIQPDALTQKADTAVDRRHTGASKMVRHSSRNYLNLHKKRKYVWFGLIYLVLLCFYKWNTIVEKWETDAYKIEFPGVSFSVGKKAGASEKPVLEKPAVAKINEEKPASGKAVGDNVSSGKSEKEVVRKKTNQKEKNTLVSGAEKETSSNKIVATTDVPASVDKNQNVVTLSTDTPGFDPLSTSSPKEVELLLKLASRRQDIEKREALLKERELALSVIEKQQKDKIAELTKLKESIEVLLKKTDKNSQEQLTSLVKIYEGMKPKQAAHIFDRMEMVVLKDLIPLMSQRKVSAILDQMSITKAKELSLALIGNKNPFAKASTPPVNTNAPKK